MKTVKTIILTLIVLVSSQSFGQNEPDKETTIEYVNKIMNDTEGYENIFNGGSGDFKIDYVSEFLTGSSLLFIVKPKDESLYCSIQYYYLNINWAKMLKIDLSTITSISSPVKYLKINFVSNSILWKGYRFVPNQGKEPCNDGDFEIERSINYIYIPYRDEEGVRERLIKALNHLSKLEKEEQAKNDPFGN